MRTVCFVGDSMVRGWDMPAEDAWPARVIAAETRRGHPAEGFNLGIAKDTTRAIGRRWQHEAVGRLASALAAHRARAGLVFAFGLDDMADFGGDGIRVALPDALDQAEQIIAAATAWAPTLWIGPPPLACLPRIIGRPDGLVYPAERSEALAGAYRGIARRLGVPFLDLHGLLRASPHWRRAMARWQAGRPAPELHDMVTQAVLGWEAWSAWWGRSATAAPPIRTVAAGFRPLRVEAGRLV
ncbi:GDSL-type esterase/lipase family protein [Roseospira goensis]|uniref:SGNH hydrolase-type esterase domain-containing protein n=1 Tax=Roseospira goensis TaxID=391922 RepID=A0A7W6RZ28_9PROT|nr:GDSL-type esterase/lipase family protein [Roseospira goensis]MBB4285234.1 hypothetical protein [Roseospira goensis]